VRRTVLGLMAIAAVCIGCTATSPWPRGEVEVDAPPADDSAVEVCPDLMLRLPDELIGDRPRPVRSDNPFVRAWGADPVVVVCGTAEPDLDPGGPVVAGNGVEWTVDSSDPTTDVWTTVGRRVAVQLRMPAGSLAAGAIALTSVIRQSVPREA
jgi:hypothetical protein